MSEPSEIKKTWPAALGERFLSAHNIIKSTKFDKPMRERRFLMDLNGSGIPYFTIWISEEKLPFTPGP